MEKGFNSSITVEGISYHVQTEDWGEQNPFLVTRIFRNGTVVKSYKSSRDDALQKGPVSEGQALRLAMKDQHLQILDLLHSGQLDLL